MLHILLLNDENSTIISLYYFTWQDAVLVCPREVRIIVHVAHWMRTNIHIHILNRKIHSDELTSLLKTNFILQFQVVLAVVEAAAAGAFNVAEVQSGGKNTRSQRKKMWRFYTFLPLFSNCEKFNKYFNDIVNFIFAFHFQIFWWTNNN